MVDFMENPTIKWMIWGDHDETETSINLVHPQVIPETCRLGTGEAAESPTSESDAPSENSESPAGRPSNGSCRSVDHSGIASAAKFPRFSPAFSEILELDLR